MLALAWVFSFVFAQVDAQPHELPVAVAGPSARVAELTRRVETAAGEPYDVRRLDDAAAARAALRDGEIYVAIVVGGERARLLTASARGRRRRDADDAAGTVAGYRTTAPHARDRPFAEHGA